MAWLGRCESQIKEKCKQISVCPGYRVCVASIFSHSQVDWLIDWMCARCIDWSIDRSIDRSNSWCFDYHLFEIFYSSLRLFIRFIFNSIISFLQKINESLAGPLPRNRHSTQAEPPEHCQTRGRAGRPGRGRTLHGVWADGRRQNPRHPHP